MPHHIVQEQLKGIKACVFDAYGTLFDVHSAVGAYREQLGKNAEQISFLWRSKQLEYTWLRSLMKKHADFWQITQEALDFACATHQVTDQDLKNKLMNAYLSLDCYPEVRETFTNLKNRGFQLAILSNGTPKMLEAAVTNAGIADLLDDNLSVEDVGIFKPDPKVYQLAVNRLQVQPHEIIFQSSNGWNAAGAATFGFHVAWINRLNQSKEQLPDMPDFELDNLMALPELLTS